MGLRRDDAADGDPEGRAPVSNGLALWKLHHAAFEPTSIVVHPDHRVEARLDVLEEIDGPMSTHGLEGFHGVRRNRAVVTEARFAASETAGSPKNGTRASGLDRDRERAATKYSGELLRRSTATSIVGRLRWRALSLIGDFL